MSGRHKLGRRGRRVERPTGDSGEKVVVEVEALPAQTVLVEDARPEKQGVVGVERAADAGLDQRREGVVLDARHHR